MSYNSKYTGQEVENLLDQVKNGEVGGGSSAYPMVKHGTNDTTFELTPNTFHVWGEVPELDLTLGEEVVGVTNEYLFQFHSGNDTNTMLVLPDNLKWMDGMSDLTSKNTTYQVSILNGYIMVSSYDITKHLTQNKAYLEWDSVNNTITISFDYSPESDLEITILGDNTYTKIYEKDKPYMTYNIGSLPAAPEIKSINPLYDDLYFYLW